jgi:hypothetical protein
LKKQVKLEAVISEDISSIVADPMQPMVPVKILKTRLIQRGAGTVKQALVKWSDLPESLGTWEDEGCEARRSSSGASMRTCLVLRGRVS